ncbi:hypothetical protein [Desulfobacula sp.]|uniref:hypothetical protein n=1 Tax=Desulfobacula sp. TaxID=2593537 RepID=UPI00262BB07A|nr:hypothetical protein [Desulfobacula sp.]
MSDPGLEQDNLLSQDELDQFFASSSTDGTEEKQSSDDDESLDMLGTLSREDKALFSNSDVSEGKDLLDEGDLDPEDMELISQDDIDSLMNASADEDFEMLSLDDLDDLIAGETAETEVEGDTVDPDPQDDRLIETDSMDQMVQTPGGEETAEPGEGSNSQTDEDIIAASEAVDIQGSLIAQETLDALMQPADDEMSSLPDILDEADPAVSQDDIDALLYVSEDDKEQAGAAEEDDEDILISQDDIDTLLRAADQEDEDVLGDLMDNAGDDSLDDAVADEDILGNEDFDADETSDETHPVVLEGDDQETAVPPLGEKIPAGSPWVRSKRVIVCASVLIVLGITVPAAYFFFSSGESRETGQSESILQFAVKGQTNSERATVDLPAKSQGDMKKPGNIVLTDFIILSSDQSTDMVYIAADISIDYADQRVYHEIQNNLSFYRDLIYDSLNKNLVFEKRELMTEADLLLSIETTLKKVLPGSDIARVSFKSFSAT